MKNAVSQIACIIRARVNRRLVAALLISLGLHTVVGLALEYGPQSAQEGGTLTGSHRLLAVLRDPVAKAERRAMNGTATDDRLDLASPLTTEALPENTSKLTRLPELISNGPVEFEEEDGLPTAGHLRFRLTIDRNGRPIQVRVLRSTLPRQVEGLVLQSFMRERYRPGEIEGRPVVANMVIDLDLGQP